MPRASINSMNRTLSKASVRNFCMAGAYIKIEHWEINVPSFSRVIESYINESLSLLM